MAAQLGLELVEEQGLVASLREQLQRLREAAEQLRSSAAKISIQIRSKFDPKASWERVI